MLTRIQLCLRNIVPDIRLLDDVMTHVRARSVLSLGFYSEPWDAQKATGEGRERAEAGGSREEDARWM